MHVHMLLFVYLIANSRALYQSNRKNNNIWDSLLDDVVSRTAVLLLKFVLVISTRDNDWQLCIYIVICLMKQTQNPNKWM